MFELLESCQTNFLLALMILYFTIGRFGLVLAILLGIGPTVTCTVIILGIEMIQVPFFYHFYSFLLHLFRKIKGFFRRRPTEAPTDEHKEKETPPEGFFMRRLKPLGPSGAGLLAALPFKGCGVWSSVLLGRSLALGKVRLYALVAGGTAVGIISLALFGVLFQEAAQAFIVGLDPTLESLFNKP
ncbi:small multi-drug export protein [Planctomycetota bacterium]